MQSAEPGEDRVRAELAALAADPDSAPEIPAPVSARVLTALRAAGPAHTDRPLRWRRTALWCGAAAALLAIGVGAAALIDTSAPARSTGPTAELITVTRRSAPMPLPDGEILALLTRPADLGALADPQRWSACLSGLRRDPATPVLGATPVTVDGRPAVLVVLRTGESGPVDSVTAVVLDAGCGAADTRPLAEKTLHRP